MLNKLWGAGAAVINKGSETIGAVGSKVQQKLDETGVSQNVSYYANYAAESTVTLGSKIYTTTTEKM